MRVIELLCNVAIPAIENPWEPTAPSSNLYEYWRIVEVIVDLSIAEGCALESICPHVVVVVVMAI
jgi:hypothetical protein